jgi:hypothetical protein
VQRQRTVAQAAAAAAAGGDGWQLVPGVPMTGDDQASTIHTALSNLEGSTDDEGLPGGSQPPSTAASRDAAGAAAVAKAAAAEDEAGGVPHRWQVVGMMALSFVLCNMDKVS